MVEAGGPDLREEAGAEAFVGDEVELVGRHLDARNGAVVAHPAIGKAGSEDGVLGQVHGMQLLGAHGLAVRDAAGEARRGWLQRAGQAKFDGYRTDVSLGRAGLREGVEDAVFLRGPAARTIRARCVVGVLPIGDRVEAELVDHLRVEDGEQFVLAVVAAVDGVGRVVRVRQLVRRHLDQSQAELLGLAVGQPSLPLGERGRHAEQQHRVLMADCSRGEGREHGGVDPAGVRNSDPRLPGPAGRLRRRARLAQGPFDGVGDPLEPSGQRGVEVGVLHRGQLPCSSRIPSQRSRTS